jgi:hypothetical protein
VQLEGELEDTKNSLLTLQTWYNGLSNHFLTVLEESMKYSKKNS